MHCVAISPRIPAPLQRALLVSQAAALVWWGAALLIRHAGIGVPVWYDQSITFTKVTDILNPYAVPTFLYPPWAALLFFPNSLPPLPAATLIQTCLFFALLTLLVFKYGGGLRAVLIALTSFVAFVAVLELNIEWMVCIGLLVPPAFSGPFLFIKPQVALGVWLSFSRGDLLRALGVLALVGGLSVLVWGAWPDRMIQAIRTYTLGTTAYSQFNLAPLRWLPLPAALVLGFGMAWWAFRRRDPVLSILAWLCFVPYITFYSLLLPLTLSAVRWPRAALLISIVLWIVYGGVIALALLRV